VAPYFNDSSDKQIRLVSALCYVSSGIVGLIYILLNGKNNRSQFFQFHFIQALLLGILMVLFSWAGSGIANFIMGVLGLFGPAAAGVAQTVGVCIGLALQLITVVLWIANIFGIVQCVRGKYADMPVVSKIARSNMR